MNQVQHVLVAVGHFPQDDPVLLRAVEIARAHSAALTIAHVIDNLNEIAPMPAEWARIQHQVQLIARENIEAGVAQQNVDISRIDIRIESGSPHTRLIEVANEIDADLIVIGAHQGDSILEKIIGSTTDRVIRASHTPVLVVKRPVEKAYQQIVVAIDTAEDFDALAPSVNALFPAAGLSLIHVVQIPPQFEAAMLRSGSGESIGVHRDALVDNAKSALRQIAQTLKNFPIRITTKAVVGNPATLLVRATWSPKVDLIVLGPSDRSTGWRALLGSVTRRVLKTATCDVLIFRVDPQQAGE